MRFFQNILGFAAAFAATGSLVAARPATGGSNLAARGLVDAIVPVNVADNNVNVLSSRDVAPTLAGVVTVVADLKAKIDVIVVALG
jgi:hypothetical protein